MKVSRKLVETLLLESVLRDLFTEEGLAVFNQEVARFLADQRRTRKPELAQATARLKMVEAEIEHIMKAIKAGIVTVSTKAVLEQVEAERAQLIQVIQGQRKMLDRVTTLLPNITERFRKLVDDLATVTQQQVDKARGILLRLVGDEIVVHSSADRGERYRTAELSGDYSGLVGLIEGGKLNLVAVTRIERVTRGL